MSEPKMSEIEPKKMVRRSVAIALGIICIILIAGMVEIWLYYSVQDIKRDETIANLNNEVFNKDSQISQLNSQIATLNNQINDLNATVNLAKSTSWGNYTLDSGATGWDAGTHASYAGYVSFVASSSSAFNVSVELSYALSNGISYDRTAYVGSESFSSSGHTYEDSAWFPILPSGVKVTVTNLSPYASVTTSVTYFY